MKKKNKFKKLLPWLICIAVALALVFGIYGIQKLNNKIETEITVEQAQQIVTDTIASLPNTVSTGAKFVAENTVVTVEELSYGTSKDIILDCTYKTMNIGDVVVGNVDKYMETVYAFYKENEAKGVKTNATKIKLFVADMIKSDLLEANPIEGEVKVYLYETKPGEFTPYLSDELINTVFGGIIYAKSAITSTTTVNYNGETVTIDKLKTLRTGINDCISLVNYDSTRPDTSVPIERVWNNFKYDFHRNFIEGDRYMYLVNGLLTTLKISAFAALFGIALGFIIAVIRCINQRTGKISFLATLCKGYISIMRGTPLMVQLLIIYFVILAPLNLDAFVTAVICFGLNSGAYVSEIVRGGIMAIDEGQTEAGRSLGFNYIQTMWYIIIPQAFKAVLPSLANEFITLLKETSIAFYIGVADLTLGGNRIRSQTFSNFMPLIAVALIYLVVVLGLSKLVELLERRLAKSDRR